MAWFRKRSGRRNAASKMIDYIPLSGGEDDDEKRRRVNTLAPEEYQVYKWLREGYSRKWTAETLYKSRSEVRMLEGIVCRKLGVEDFRGIVRFYAILDKNRPEAIVPNDAEDRDKRGSDLQDGNQ